MHIKTYAKKLSDNNALMHRVYLVAHRMKVLKMQQLDNVTYAKAYYRDKTGD